MNSKKEQLIELQREYNRLERESIDLHTYQANLTAFATDDTGPEYEETSNTYNQDLTERIMGLNQAMENIKIQMADLES